MCGFVGMVRARRPAGDRRLLERLADILEHRGPDDVGFLGWSPGGPARVSRSAAHVADAHVVVAHRRLSILDLSAAGWQPMSTDDSRYHLVFNGEVYNYLELQCELKALGHRFRSHCDTEVVLLAFAEWGEAALRRMVGMFAFAILDERKGKLFLARDPFGIKPLYYTVGGHSLAFASEIKALLELPGESRRADPQRVYEYLRFGVTDHGERTCFAEIRQLPAAHWAELDLARPAALRLTRYWSLAPEPRTDLSFQDAAGQLRELFLDSIRLHLRSDVPVGAALSGGIDSSAIVMAMRDVEPGLDLHTISYVADEPGVSEERWVDVVAAAANAKVHKVNASADDLAQDLDSLIRAHDEPFGSTTIYPHYQVFRRARECGIKVMLDGQGADELLGGYRAYIAARAASLVRQGAWTELHRFLQETARLPGVRRSHNLMLALSFVLPPRLQEPLRRLTRQGAGPPWLNGRWFADRGVTPGPLGYSSSPEVLREQLLRGVLEMPLPHLLRYEDRNSMAWSVESRVPFLTPQLAHFVLSLPENFLVARDGTSKAVFREAMRGLVPDPVLDRRDKLGFATPEPTWMRALHPLIDSLMDGEAVHSALFDRDRLRRDWDRMRREQNPYDLRIWRWLNLARWAELYDVRFT